MTSRRIIGALANISTVTALVVSSGDGGLSWSKPRQLADDNFVFGPGKGIRKAGGHHRGRLLLPGHVEGQAMVHFSDDHGLNWHRGGGLQGGNETDVADLSDGRLCLATRHIASIGRSPEPNGGLFSISTDGEILLLYENGNMAYSERISLARIPRHKLLPSPTPE